MHRIAPASNPQQLPLFPLAGWLADLAPVVPSALLGTTTNTSSQPVTTRAWTRSTFFPLKENLTRSRSKKEFSKARYLMQKNARKAAPNFRVAHCTYSLVKNAYSVPIVASKKAGTASYKNVQLCGSVWVCPICANRIAERRRAEVSGAMRMYKEKTGGQVLLITRTFPHHFTDRLADLMAGLKEAERAYKSGRAWESVKERHGIVGSIRNVELTFGENGWHPHIHELVFLPAHVDKEQLKADLFLRWVNACTRSGLGTPSEAHGLDVRSGENASSYVTKMGRDDVPESRQWTGADEVTKSHTKTAKDSAYSPFDLLRAMAQTDDLAIHHFAQARFLEFAEATKGKRQLVVSPGLSEYFDEIQTDEEAASPPEQKDDEVVATLTKEGFFLVRRLEERAQVLNVALQCDRQAIVDYVLGLAPPGTSEGLLFVPVGAHVRYRQKGTLDADDIEALKRGEEEQGTALPAAIV